MELAKSRIARDSQFPHYPALHAGYVPNEALGLGVPGKHFWMRDCWDRYIRDQRHRDTVVAYIHENPVKMGLCGKPSDWPWSSMAYGRSIE